MGEGSEVGNKNRIDAAGLAIAKILFTECRIKRRKEAPPARELAGAPGFEPRSTAPKAGVLPLHHAPELTAIRTGCREGIAYLWGSF